MQKHRRAHFLDIEATCDREKVKGKTQKIIEIGVCSLDLKTLKIDHAINLIVRPEEPFEISEFCTELTHLTMEIVDMGRSFIIAHELLRKEYNPNAAWFTWGDFDKRMLDVACRREGLPPLFEGPHFNMKALDAIARQQREENGLLSSMAHYKMEFIGDQHVAVNDAVNTARIGRASLHGYREEKGECDKIKSLVVSSR